MNALPQKSVNPWNQILELLELEVGAPDFARWLRPTSLESVSGDVLLVRVPNPTFKDWIDANYEQLIHKAIVALELPFVTVEFTTGPIPPGRSETPAASPPDTNHASGENQLAPEPLRARYTFETFVVGASNQLAHAAACRVTEDPGRSYNPLFLYGGSGLGKTHLLHAVGHALRTRFPQWRVMYLPAERFMNELVVCIRNNTMPVFRQRYREVDALLLDDIQFVSGKEIMQEEFFHTFNVLHERQRPIVLSCDRAPKQIAEIEDRLRSRFEWGLLADVQPPDLETRVAILMKKAEAERFPLPEKIGLFIATNVKSNIRELEGSLVRLIALASLTGEEVSEAMARQALQGLAGESKRVTIELIQKVVCEVFNLRVQDLRAKDNSKRVVLPRQVAMWLARQMTEASLPEIARAFGDRHHTTVLHSIGKINRERSIDKEINRMLNRLMSQLE